jgi:hypothetical protein
MANLVWTGILYFSTLAIVVVAFRTFVNDRRSENELRVANQIRVAQGLGRMGVARSSAVIAAALPAAPGEETSPAPRRFVAPPRSARANAVPANIRRA